MIGSVARLPPKIDHLYENSGDPQANKSNAQVV